MVARIKGSGKRARSGGGIRCDGSATANNCTISGNSAEGGGGVATEESLTLRNCIVFGNSPANYGEGVDFESSCTAPNPGGSGNIANDPQFVDSDAGDYRLRSVSPCVDKGTNAYATGSADLDGNPRIVNSTVDMGAYEYQRLLAITNPPTIVGSLTWTNKAAVAGGVVAATGKWQVASVALAPGDNLVLIVGTNAAGAWSRDSVVIWRSLEDPGNSPDHLVWTNSPTPAWPYTNWATAAHTIQLAVDTASTKPRTSRTCACRTGPCPPTA